ncbi:Uncharacterised protein [Serratia quinivorans]|nr:Uncharacterised protein [Serratia quinivorans]
MWPIANITIKLTLSGKVTEVAARSPTKDMVAIMKLRQVTNPVFQGHRIPRFWGMPHAGTQRIFLSLRHLPVTNYGICISVLKRE